MLSALRRPALLLVLLTVACGGSDLRVEALYDRDASFEGLNRYRWRIEQGADRVIDPLLDNNLLDARIRRSVNAYLQSVGYVQDADDPDFLVGYQVLLRGSVRTETITDYYGSGASYWGGWYGYGVGYSFQPVQTLDPEYYDEGTLLFDVLLPGDPPGHIWRGIGRKAVNVTASPQERDENTLEAVRAIFALFPPPPVPDE